MEELTDPKFVYMENDRVLTLVTALYVRALYPDLTIEEVFRRLEDVEFVKEVIRHILEENDASESLEVVHKLREENLLDNQG